MQFIALISMLFLGTKMALAGIYQPHALWDKNEIIVCFYDESVSMKKAETSYYFTPIQLSKNQRFLIKHAVNENYNLNETGISFVGWDDCSKTPDFDLVLMTAELTRIYKWTLTPFTAVANIGDPKKYSTIKKRAQKQDHFAMIALRDFTYYVIVHEFGHVLGLFHEHEHIEAGQDPNCLISYQTGEKKLRNLAEEGMGLGPLAEAVIHTPYDPNSVMNYCNPNNPSNPYADRKQVKVLSELDRMTLKDLYSRPMP